MNYENWARIAEDVDNAQISRELVVSNSRRMLKERAQLIASGKQLKLKGMNKRTSTLTLKIYPWAAIRISELADQRCVADRVLAANILESTAHLWGKHPYDQNLYLSRSVSPLNAEVMIDPYASDQPPISPDSRANTYNMLGHAVFRLLQMGVEPHELAEHMATMFQIGAEYGRK